MKRTCAVILLFGNFCFGQQNKEIEKPIRNLFSGMKNADAELLKSAFSDTAILQTITQDGVKTENINNLSLLFQKWKKRHWTKELLLKPFIRMEIWPVFLHLMLFTLKESFLIVVPTVFSW